MKLTSKLLILLLLVVSVFISCDLATTQYTITFDTGEWASVDPQIINENGTVTEPADPTSEGIVFAGWYEDEELTTLYDFDIVVDRDITLYAKWVEGITVSFDSDGGSAVSDVEVFEGDSLTRPEDPTYEGYTFAGWYVMVDDDQLVAYDFNNSVRGDFTLYAVWTNNEYKVYFDWNNDSEPEEYPGDHTFLDVTYGLPMPSAYIDAQRIGYTFEGVGDLPNYEDYDEYWYLHVYYYDNMASARLWDKAENSTLYGIWSPNSYTVTLKPNGGSGEDIDITVTYDQDMPSGVIAHTRDGYAFDGYYDDATNGTQYYDKDMDSTHVWDIAENDYLYAHWTQLFTVTFSGTDISDKSVRDGEAVSEPTEPTRSGYEFDGWYTSDSFTTEYDFDATITADTTIYAQWTELFTVSFSGTEISDKSVRDGEAVSEPTEPTRSGYEFDGWYTSDSFTTEYDFDAIITADTTIYAKWTATQYDITYYLDEGTNSGSNPSSYTIEDDDITLENPTKTGYVFDGWYGDSSYTGSEIEKIDTSAAENVDVYAKWIEVYTVSFVDNDGDSETSINDQEINSGDSATEPTAPTKTGYDFDGWYSDPALTSSYSFSSSVTADITLYGKFTAKSTEITFNFQGGRDGSLGTEATYDYDMPSALIAPISDSYDFLGYFDKSSGGTEYYDSHMASSKAWDKDSETATLYAHWTPKTYTVTFDQNGGVGGADTIEAFNNQKLPVLEDVSAPTKTDYIFQGYEDVDGTLYYDGDLTPILVWNGAADFTLYAKWVMD